MKYRVTTHRIVTDKGEHFRDDVIDVPGADVERLLQLGCIEPAEGEPATPPPRTWRINVTRTADKTTATGEMWTITDERDQVVARGRDWAQAYSNLSMTDFFRDPTPSKPHPGRATSETVVFTPTAVAKWRP